VNSTEGHKEKQREYCRRYRERHRDRVRESNRRTAAARSDEVRERRRLADEAYRKANPDVVKETLRKYREGHRSELAAKARRRYAQECDILLERKRQARKLDPERFRHWDAESKARNREHILSYGQDRRDGLHDGYVSYVLTKGSGLRAKDIPPQLVELKRAQIQLRRFLNGNDKG
jgi:hypothetical protein